MLLIILFTICAAGSFGWAPNYGVQWCAHATGFQWSPSQGQQWYAGQPIRVPFSGFALYFPVIRPYESNVTK